MNNSISSPIDTVVSWYESLPEDVKLDVTYLISSSMPGFETVKSHIGNPDFSLFVTSFVDILLESKRDLLLEIGMIINIRAAIDYFIIYSKKDVDWKSNQADLQLLAKQTGKEIFKKKAREQEFRNAQWEKAYDSWNKIRKKNLTDSQIYQYKIDVISSLRR